MKRSFAHSFVRAFGVLSPQSLAGFVVAMMTALVWATPAFAQNSLGDMFCNARTNMQGFGDLYSAAAYIMGAGFIGWGLYELVKHHENPREKALHFPLMKIGGGGALMAAPEVALALIQTFYNTPSGGGLNACNVVAATPSSANGVGLDVLIENLVNNIKDPMAYALSALAIIIGLLMIVRGLLKASKYNTDPRSHSLNSILANLIVGTILIVVGQSTDELLTTLFGYDWTGVKGGGGAPARQPSGGWTFVTPAECWAAIHQCRRCSFDVLPAGWYDRFRARLDDYEKRVRRPGTGDNGARPDPYSWRCYRNEYL